MAKSKNAGASTAEVEVTSISRHGFWLYLAGRELFVSFQDFPWFADAPVVKLTRVECPSPNHLHWPELDIDLSVDSIERPADFPLMFDPRQASNLFENFTPSLRIFVRIDDAA